MNESHVDEPGHGQALRVWRAGNIVRAAGEVDLVTAPLLADELTETTEVITPPGPLVVDLTDVTFFASAGLSVLIEHHQHCVQRGVELRVVPGNKTIARTLDMTGLTGTLAVFDTLTKATETEP